MKKFIRNSANAAQDFLQGPKSTKRTTTKRLQAEKDVAPESHLGILPPTSEEIMRYRYNHGTNLGSIFVLEKWLHPRMFDCCSKDRQTSELESVRSVVKARGAETAQQKFEEHWSNALTDADLDWLVNKAHCTCLEKTPEQRS